MSSKTLTLIPLLMSAALLSGCGGGSTPTTQGTAIDTTSTGNTQTSTTTLASLTTNNAATVMSSTLHDILDIAQIMLAAQAKTRELQLNIEAALRQSITQTLNNLSCDNAPGVYNIIIQNIDRPGYDLSGATLTINLGGEASGPILNPDVYCRLAGTNMSGLLQITRISFAPPDPARPGDWQLSGEIWPTVTIHKGSSLTAMNNPVAFNASYTPEGGLIATASVMDTGTFPGSGISGMVITHFPAGTNPNDQPSDVLQFGSIITATRDTVDPAAASLFTISADSVINSNLTGTDINMTVRTADSSANPQPITWTSNIIDAPFIEPPVAGAMTTNDNTNGSSVTAAISPASGGNSGYLNLEITDNTLPPDDPNRVTTVVTTWAEILALI